MNIEIGPPGARRGVGYAFGFRSPHAIAAGWSGPARDWKDQLSRLALDAGGAPLEVAAPARDLILDRLVDGIRALNRAYPYQVETIDGVPAVQLDGLDGGRLELDFGRLEDRYRVTEVVHAPEVAAVVAVSGRGGVSRHGRRRFPFQGAVKLLGGGGISTKIEHPSNSWTREIGQA